MRYKICLLLLTSIILYPAVFAGQNKPAKPAQPTDIADVIQRFASAESRNKIARNNYTFTQDVDVMTIGPANSISGRFHRISDIVYDDLGNRVEKITFFPASTLSGVNFTQTDIQDLAGVQPFALTLEDLPKYQVDYVGKERLDELDTYVFDVAPIKMVKGQR